MVRQTCPIPCDPNGTSWKAEDYTPHPTAHCSSDRFLPKFQAKKEQIRAYIYNKILETETLTWLAHSAQITNCCLWQLKISRCITLATSLPELCDSYYTEYFKHHSSNIKRHLILTSSGKCTFLFGCSALIAKISHH